MEEEKRMEKGRRNNRKSHLTSYAVIAASIVVILAGVHAAKVILAPIFMATFFAVLLLPILTWLRKRGLSEVTSLTAIIVLVLVCGGAVTSILASQLTRFYLEIPEYRDRFSTQLMNYNINLQDYFPTLWRDKEEEPASGQESSPGSPEGVDALRQRGVAEPQSSGEQGSSSGMLAATFSGWEKSTIVPVAWQVEVQESGEREPDRQLTKSGSLPPSLLSEDSEGETSHTAGEESAGSQPAVAHPISDPLPRGFWDEESVHHGGGRDLVGDGPAVHEEDKGSGEGEVHSPLISGDWSRTSEDAMKASSKELFRFIAGLTGELSMLASSSFIIMLLVIFMLLEASTMPLKIKSLNKVHFTNERLNKVAEDIRHYMLIKTFVSILVGTCVTALLVATKVQYPLLWGFVAFLLNYIPNIGSVVAAIPPIILATVDHGLLIGGVNVVFFVLINCSIGYILEPKLLGDGLDLSPLVVLLSLLFCGWLLGPVGMFLSPPLAVIAKIILASFAETEWIATLMAQTVKQESRESKPPGEEPSPAGNPV
ncbi:MAG: AI-2E family transporter [Planctomycetia bacterium]|nr:AI-2E family transporter [Planctomycetia bacterium]